MSIENAILELAAAIHELAASNLATAGSPAHARAYEHAQHEEQMDRMVAAEKAQSTTIEQDVTKVETDAKAEQKKVMAAVEADRKPSTAKEAVADALAKAKAEKEAAKPAPAPEPEDDPLDAAPLDWDKDVRPALLAVGKDRDALVKLMGKYEVPKGGKAPAEKWADLLAEANAIVAARG